IRAAAATMERMIWLLMRMSWLRRERQHCACHIEPASHSRLLLPNAYQRPNDASRGSSHDARFLTLMK
ncbi:hypothetical protein, partial [Mesorhizobium sp.]|uniref:hypothetical protein n=1 Tax=Mesorhizobium sp. TaxID=1871066 RepID=UPI0025B805D5